MLDMSKKAKEYNPKNWKKERSMVPQSLRTCLDVSCDKCALFITKEEADLFYFLLFWERGVIHTQRHLWEFIRSPFPPH
jgi:hypothetical protein